MRPFFEHLLYRKFRKIYKKSIYRKKSFKYYRKHFLERGWSSYTAYWFPLRKIPHNLTDHSLSPIPQQFHLFPCHWKTFSFSPFSFISDIFSTVSFMFLCIKRYSALKTHRNHVSRIGEHSYGIKQLRIDAHFSINLKSLMLGNKV